MATTPRTKPAQHKTTKPPPAVKRLTLTTPAPGKVIRTAIISDIHFDLHDAATWNAFTKWHATVKPEQVVVLGDFLDLGMISRYTPGTDDPVYVIPQIRMFVTEMNKLAKTSSVYVVEGNHDERWDKHVLGALPFLLRDSIGLTLREQCYNQGLDHSVVWCREGTSMKGVKVGPFMLRHGHKQSGRFGGGKHLAANRLMKSLGTSEVFGHHHRAQMFCQTALGKTAIAIANPCMTKDHSYAGDSDWQRGFTVLEEFNGGKSATPYVIVMDDGRFSWNGALYDGNK